MASPCRTLCKKSELFSWNLCLLFLLCRAARRLGAAGQHLCFQIAKQAALYNGLASAICPQNATAKTNGTLPRTEAQGMQQNSTPTRQPAVNGSMTSLQRAQALSQPSVYQAVSLFSIFFDDENASAHLQPPTYHSGSNSALHEINAPAKILETRTTSQSRVDVVDTSYRASADATPTTSMGLPPPAHVVCFEHLLQQIKISQETVRINGTSRSSSSLTASPQSIGAHHIAMNQSTISANAPIDEEVGILNASSTKTIPVAPGNG